MSKKNIVVLALGLLFVSLFFMTYVVWPGSKKVYLMFTVSFMLLLYFSIKHQPSAGYVFLAFALWIGFWLKLSLHTLDPTLQWMEPTGLFDFSRDSWDKVAIIASVGALAVLFGGLFTLPLKGALKINWLTGFLSGMDCVALKRKMRDFHMTYWIVGLGVFFGIVFLNEIFNIVHSVVPAHSLNLPLHLQGLFNWFVGGGGFLFLMIPLFFDVNSGYFLRGSGLILVVSIIVGISIYSRGVVVFQSLTILLTLFVYHNFLPRIPVKQLLKFFLLIIISVVISIVLTAIRREAFFASVQPTSVQPTFSGYTAFLIFKLPIERWIGLEGVMAMSAHHEKGSELLYKAINERRVLGELDMYTRDVALSPSTDTKTVMYATPPSVFAFWYYSGSLFVVFIATLLLTAILLTAEFVVMRVTKNPFLSAGIGVGGTIQIIHMGTGGLLIPAIIFVTSIAFALLIGSISNYYIFGRLR